MLLLLAPNKTLPARAPGRPRATETRGCEARLPGQNCDTESERWMALCWPENEERTLREGEGDEAGEGTPQSSITRRLLKLDFLCLLHRLWATHVPATIIRVCVSPSRRRQYSYKLT